MQRRGRRAWIQATLRALLRGERHIGCTLHYITDGTIDTGPIVATARVPVSPDRSLLSHVLSLYPPGVEMLVDAVEQLAAGRALPTTPQLANDGAYYSRPGAEEWAAFTRAGWRAVELRDLDEVLRRYMPGLAR